MSEIQKISIAHFTTASGVLYESIDLYYEHFGQAVHQAPRTVVKSFESPYNGQLSKEVELFTWEKLDYVSSIKKSFQL